MPNIYEKHVSRPWVVDAKTASITREFVVTGTTDETEVYELVLAATTVIYDNLVRRTMQADPQGGGIWFVSVEYGTIDPQQAVDSATPVEPVQPGLEAPLGPSFSFDTSGGTVHITQSRSTRSMTLSTGAAAPDNAQAIGLTKDRVEGCDIHAPQLQWQLEVQRANCTGQYLMGLFANTGKVNYAAPFRGFAQGELLYLGATGRFTQRERWTITHKFAANLNQINLAVGGGITVADKRGWDYLWIGYAPETVGNKLLNVPKAAYVEVVYPTGDFAQLGIG